ncbi:hypothetical protein DDE82_009088 [Stemphylium lycopersici]|uniref:PD-(D/E)XK nuclease-like domain-containing protein n=1 Tax=Stemphylium lycopersici TaxID=183478 RepID=A0A364MRZ9_STELY|nr:hypothetical protein TW65_99340 [Stemphylium lycopersici]RAQ98608.1 hypothetical protein DDE82_009088 [Stemphylium lycopersici]RAR01382.1 hypothetical protein DDE83_008922 [Stemphylium lycopersici]
MLVVLPVSDSEVLPTHSISAAGATSSANPLTLHERNTFSPSGSQTSARNPRRANSPSRDNIAVLATACPPTITEPSSGLKEPPPTRVTDVMERLEEGLEGGWIPGQLRKLIEEDTDFGYQGLSGVPGPQAPHLICWTWLLAARRVRQSQAINATFLSSVPDTACNSRLLDRKADFTPSFSHRPSPGFEDLYSRLRCAGNPIISHVADAFTKTTALFSCVEVKPANGDLMEAEYQLSIWMAANLRKKMQLARCAGILDKSSLVEPCFAIVGHETHIYLAYMASEDVVRIQGPEQGFSSACETSSVSGIFRTLKLWRNVIKYGRDEGSEGFWGGFMGVVLQRLAQGSEE